jgi:hypothetical protein
MTPNKITSEYLHALQAVYHRIDSRGILEPTPKPAPAKTPEPTKGTK